MNKSNLAQVSHAPGGMIYHHPPGGAPETGKVPAKQLVDAFFSGRNQRTIQAYTQDLQDFRIFIGASNAEEAARHLLSSTQGEANALALSYKTHLLERKLSPATINRRLAALRSMVKLARTLGMVPWMLDVENIKVQPYRDTKGPGLTAFCQIMEKLNERNNAKTKRDRAIFRLLYDLGLRREEAARLDIGDVDLKAGTLAVIGKGAAEKQILSLPEPTQNVLKDWLEVRGTASAPLFTNFDHAGKGQERITGTGIYLMVRGLGQKLGIHVRPHGIRHTAITEAVKAAQANDIGLEEVMDFSRHKDIKTLMIYRDRERNVQGQLAELLAAAAQFTPGTQPLKQLVENDP